MNLFLYALTVLIWGTTWLAIHFQVGEVEVMLSVFYRFALAGLLFFPLLLLLKKRQTTRWQDHLYFLLQGGCLFSFNFLCFYTASEYVVSGLISVVFSAATLFNAINGRLIWGEKVKANTLLAIPLGFAGLILLFWDSLQSVPAGAASQAQTSDTLYGLGLSLLGTYLFSLGNMLSVRHSRHGLRPWTTNAYAMSYGALILLGIILVKETPWQFSTQPVYLGSLLYLAIPGSIIGFTAYLSLVARMGANQAAYATVMFPVVALSISSFAEGYVWTPASLVGLLTVLLGNAIALGSLQWLRDRWRVRMARQVSGQ